MAGKKFSKFGKSQKLKVALRGFQVGMSEPVADLEKIHTVVCPDIQNPNISAGLEKNAALTIRPVSLI